MLRCKGLGLAKFYAGLFWPHFQLVKNNRPGADLNNHSFNQRINGND